MTTASSSSNGFWTAEIRLEVVPESPRNEIVEPMSDGRLKVKLAGGLDKGRINEELRSFLARHFGLPRASVTISKDSVSEMTLVRIAG